MSQIEVPHLLRTLHISPPDQDGVSTVSLISPTGRATVIGTHFIHSDPGSGRLHLRHSFSISGDALKRLGIPSQHMLPFIDLVNTDMDFFWNSARNP